MNKPKYELARELYNLGKYNDAFSIEIEFISDYIDLYKRHTIRLKNQNKDLYESFLNMDINCLCEAIEFLIPCYERTDRQFDILDFLDNIKGEIDSKIWSQKIFFYRILIKALIFQDESGAKEELEKIENIYNVQDVELLTLYLDLMNEKLSFSNKNQLCETIIKNTECSTLKLKYKTSIGINFFLIGDKNEAITIIEDSLKQYDIKKNLQEEYYRDYILGFTNYFLGMIKQEAASLLKSRDYYLKSLSSEKYNDEGKASLLDLIGNCYHAKGDFVLAKDYYIQSINLNKSYVVIISLIDILMHLNANKTEIEEWKLKINEKMLNENEKYDYLI